MMNDLMTREIVTSALAFAVAIWGFAWLVAGRIIDWIDNYKPKEGEQHGR